MNEICGFADDMIKEWLYHSRCGYTTLGGLYTYNIGWLIKNEYPLNSSILALVANRLEAYWPSDEVRKIC